MQPDPITEGTLVVYRDPLLNMAYRIGVAPVEENPNHPNVTIVSLDDNMWLSIPRSYIVRTL